MLMAEEPEGFAFESRAGPVPIFSMRKYFTFHKVWKEISRKL